MQVNRSEHKYMLNLSEAVLIKKQIAAIMPLDVHCNNEEGYQVRSLYFDTVHNRCCYEKLDGLRIHEKIRLRIYGNHDDVIKLESKRKDGIHQVKKSMLIHRSLAEALCKGDYEGLCQFDHPLAMYFYTRLKQGMIPKVIIQYQRLSFNLETNNTRITFDSKLCATEFPMDFFAENLMTHPILEPDKVILEVKFNGFLFEYIKKALKGLRKSATSYSKFMNGRKYY